MVEFAAKLGVRHSAISRYESDKLTPSRTVLLHLYGLAEAAAEKEVLRKLIGQLPDHVKEEAFVALARATELELNAVIREQGTSIATRENLRDLMVDVIGQKYVPLWIVEALRLWRRHRDDDGAEDEFVEAISALDRRLDAARRKRDRQ